MNIDPFTMPLAGGVLIGLSASLLLLLKGRVFGVSGILAGALVPKAGDTAWRVAALVGLVSAGFLLLLSRTRLIHGVGAKLIHGHVLGTKRHPLPLPSLS